MRFFILPVTVITVDGDGVSRAKSVIPFSLCMVSAGEVMKPLQHLVIVGGGTAGWMTAAAISHIFAGKDLQITLVESDQIGTVGVGEATIPHIRYFNQRLGIAEDEFMRATQATYKLGIEFIGWGSANNRYVHPFGEFGAEIGGVPFHHWWIKKQLLGAKDSFFDYSLPVVAALSGRFNYPTNDQSILSTYSYAFHLDAALYAQLLRGFAEKRGVVRYEGKVTQVLKAPESGDITGVLLDNGRTIFGDFFVDCSGFRALLIEKALDAGFESWKSMLPCDSAHAMPTEAIGDPAPFTRAIAESAGWQWRIPLQHRLGNGHVYASDFMSDEAAMVELEGSVSGRRLAEPKLIRFEAGRRKASWLKNCVAIGLSSGFLEPLESTSIYLIQLGIMKLVELFPSSQGNEARQAEFNRVMEQEYVTIRDFLILHYYANSREDSEFWRYCRNMSIPETLQERIDLFKSAGLTLDYQHGIFMLPSWQALFMGQGVLPDQIHSMVQTCSSAQVCRNLEGLKQKIRSAAAGLPSHAQALKLYCYDNRAPSWPAATFDLYGRARK